MALKDYQHPIICGYTQGTIALTNTQDIDLDIIHTGGVVSQKTGGSHLRNIS